MRRAVKSLSWQAWVGEISSQGWEGGDGDNTSKRLCMKKLRFVIIVFFAAFVGNAWGQPHGQGHSERRGPSDIQQYIESLEKPQRDRDQKPDEVINALQVDQYMTIADIGAGSGYFTRKFVWAVQDKGMVYAVDIEPAMLKYNEEMVEHLHTPYNAKFVLAKPEDPMLPSRAMDLVFLCNTYHHLSMRSEYFGRVRKSLKPGGRVAIIDFYHDERSGELGFSKDHLVPRDTVIHEMGQAGYRLIREHTFLDRQYFLEFQADERPQASGENY
jgi:predicted methyltransferase